MADDYGWIYELILKACMNNLYLLNIHQLICGESNMFMVVYLSNQSQIYFFYIAIGVKCTIYATNSIHQDNFINSFWGFYSNMIF